MYTTDAVSGPSRAGLMTGRYRQRFGIEENNVVGYMSKHGKYGLDMGVPTSEKFISNYLSEATVMFIRHSENGIWELQMNIILTEEV